MLMIGPAVPGLSGPPRRPLALGRGTEYQLVPPRVRHGVARVGMRELRQVRSIRPGREPHRREPRYLRRQRRHSQDLGPPLTSPIKSGNGTNTVKQRLQRSSGRLPFYVRSRVVGQIPWS